MFTRRVGLTLAAGLVLLLRLTGPAIAADESAPEDPYREDLRAAVSYSGDGRYREALAAYDRALAIAASADRPEWRARILRERGVSFLGMQAYEDARADFEEAVTIHESRGEVVQASKARMRIASMMMNDDPDGAAALLQRITEDLEGEGDEEDLQQARLFQARLMVLRGDLAPALPILAELRSYFEAIGSQGRVSDVLNLESWTLQQLGRLEEARTSYHELIETSFERGNQQLVAYAYCNLGDIERELGRPAVAEESLDEAIDLLDMLRSRIPGGDQERAEWLDAQVSAYDSKIELLIDDDRTVEALAVAERFHARSLLEEFREPVQHDEPALTSAEREALTPLLELQQRMVLGGLSADEREELRGLEQRLEQAGRERRRSRAPATPTPLRSIGSLQRRLPPASAILAYWVHPERSWLWVVLPDRVDRIQIPIGREELRGAIEAYLAPIRDRVRAEDLALRGGSREHLERGARLYRLLIEPALGHLRDVDHLIVVPDDHLWHLPFEALVSDVGERVENPEPIWFGDYARARFLLHDFSTLYAPSATVWAELSERPIRGGGVVAIAPSLDDTDTARERGWALSSLPGARAEAGAIAETIEPGLALLGAEATERAVKQSLADYRVVHFATHGYVHDERPLLSGLFLWPDADRPGEGSTEDGLLQGFEVRELELKAELVSLAACDSGMGQLSRAEGIVGMSRAVLVAGARNVLVSLWAVDDRASSLLMEGLYRELQTPLALPRALRRARLALLEGIVEETVVAGVERVAYAHPFFWATYVMIGGDRLE